MTPHYRQSFITALTGHLLLVMAASVSAHADRQGDEWIRKSAKLAVQRLLVPANRLSIDCPKKDWVVLPAGGTTLVRLAEKNGVALVELEHVALQQPLGPEEVTDLFAEIEADTIRQQHADATGFVSRLATVGQRRVAMLEYERPGTRAVERVRQERRTGCGPGPLLPFRRADDRLLHG
jgi:hypothetical protein